MEKNCSKYEGLFVFSDEKTLNEHLAECSYCRAEHEKMQKVSDLISEVKTHYKSRKQRIMKLKAVCAIAMIMFFSASFSIISNDADLADSLMYGEALTAEDLGFPVDSYGLIMVDDEF